ncbi:MAG TPA: flagellar motor protein MotB [Candidatus Limnocylindrales bacterium]
MARRKRRREEGPHENEERWLLTYADMITLLMALFIVMYAISTTDIRKLTVLAQSLSAAFNADIMQGQQAISISNGQDATVVQEQSASGTSPVQSDLKAIKAALEDYAIGQGLGGEVEVGMAPQGIVIRLNDALLFSSGRAHLDAHALKIVKQVADLIKPLPNAVRIEGNTDDQAPDGVLYSSNWDLSTDRALAVLKSMVDMGIDPSRMSALGNAQYNPITASVDDASRAKNRRVDIVVIYPIDSSSSAAPMAFPSF